MDPFFIEPDSSGQPPEKVHFENIIIEPYQDGNKVKLLIEITPFLEKPNIEIEMLNKTGELVSTMSIVEIIDHKFELTLHLKNKDPEGEYILRSNIYYSDLSHYEIKEDQEEITEQKAEITIVDKFEKLFEIKVKNI